MTSATGIPELVAERDALLKARDGLFDAIAHGDGEHRAWLKAAIDAHFEGEPVPPVAGNGTKEALLKRVGELEGALEDETGWLIEEEAGGVIHWIALANFAWPLTKIKQVGSRRDYDAERYMSPVQRVKDSNDALRFARKVDAEAFIQLFDRFLLCPKATEHCWPTPAALNSDAPQQPTGDRT